MTESDPNPRIEPRAISEHKFKLVPEASSFQRFEKLTMYKDTPTIATDGTTPISMETDDEAFLLHLIDVTACFVMEQNMYLATTTRKELIANARASFVKPK